MLKRGGSIPKVEGKINNTPSLLQGGGGGRRTLLPPTIHNLAVRGN